MCNGSVPSKMMLIGLAGLARSGKDTAGGYFGNSLDIETYALAQPIKETVNSLFSWDERHSDGDLKEVDDPELGFSPRKAYQLFGTEFGRGLRDDLWIRLANRKYEMLGGLIVTDIRFNNEANWIREAGGTIIHIEREDEDVPKIREHESESGVYFDKFKDIKIYNKMDESFFDRLEEVKEWLYEQAKSTYRDTADSTGP